jgi:GrpB-like predicted nucleotidyltransferase (UPF0157 family)
MPDAPIVIVPYDPAWVEAFERERAVLATTLGRLASRIERNGSTSVPGLASKPVIDIQISVERLHPLSAYAPQLATLGYLHVPHADDSQCPFFYREADPPSRPHRHHIHVVEAGGEEERRTLAFRDRLRSDPAAAREYEALKRRLAPEHGGATPESVQAYVDGKSEFIRTMIHPFANGSVSGVAAR